MKFPFEAYVVTDGKWSDGEFIVNVFPTPKAGSEHFEKVGEEMKSAQREFIREAIREKFQREGFPS